MSGKKCKKQPHSRLVKAYVRVVLSGFPVEFWVSDNFTKDQIEDIAIILIDSELRSVISKSGDSDVEVVSIE